MAANGVHVDLTRIFKITANKNVGNFALVHEFTLYLQFNQYSLCFTGWRRSHRPSIRDISIIDEEETERDAEASDPVTPTAPDSPAAPAPTAFSTPTPITVQPNRLTWSHSHITFTPQTGRTVYATVWYILAGPPLYCEENAFVKLMTIIN